MRVTENEKSVHDRESGGFPSTYWSGDEYECPGCGCRIVTGFGIGTSEPIPRRHESPASATEGSMEFSEPAVRSDADNGVDEIERLRNGLREIVSCSAVYGELAGERASELLAG